MALETRLPQLSAYPDADKPRERLFSRGVSTLSDSELLAVLLGSGSASEPVLSLAANVLTLAGGSLAGLSSFLPEELMQLRGIGRAKACTLVAALELSRRVSCAPPGTRVLLNEPGMVASLVMQELRFLKKEKFFALLLNARNELIARQEVSVGTLTASYSHPREIFSDAVRRGAGGIILVHNHPSGDPTPSAADLASTKRIVEAGRILGIPVLDHLVIGDGRFVSMKAEQLAEFG